MKQVFLSSTSRDLRTHRDAAYKAIEGLDGYHCVRMEDFGARDARPEEFCQQAVSQCDVYVGLLGHLYGSIPDGCTKSYTEMEYDAAVDEGKPRLVFLAEESFPVPAKLMEDDEHRGLQRAFRDRVNRERIRATFLSPDDLRGLVIQAIYNWKLGQASVEEIEKLASFRSAKLDAGEKASRARCALRWEAAGVPEAEAQRLAGDLSIGALGSDARPHAGKVLGVVGEVGVGKSLGVERLFQHALAAFRLRPSLPIPVYLEARALMGGLRAAVAVEKIGLGEPLLQGAFVVVDGLDEREPAAARAILDELRALVRSWPNTSAIVTTRPIERLLRAEETFEIEPLSDQEAQGLLSRFAGRSVTYLPSAWPQSIREAIRRPLFAVVLGRYMATHDTGFPAAVGDLIQDLVRRLLDRASLDPHVMEPLLRKFAALRVDRGRPVSPAEIGMSSHVDSLLRSRLVVERAGKIDFSLQILAEWFAAEALLGGEPDIEEVAEEEARLERWRYPIVVAVTVGDESASRLLPTLASRRPGFASTVARLAEPMTAVLEGASTRNDAGAKIRSAMMDWITGIGPLSGLIAPLRKDGSLGKLGYSVGASNLDTSWYVGEDIREDVFDLATNIGLLRSQPRFRMRGGRSSGGPAWPWVWSLEDLVAILTDLMNGRALPTADGPLHAEAVWDVALAACGRGSLSDEPIHSSQLEAEIKGLVDETVILKAGHSRFTVAQVRYVIELLKERGNDEIRSPWPGPDREYGKGWVWGPYSPDRLLARTRAVYGAALEGYEDLATRWFSPFAPWLGTAAALPATLKGIVNIPTDASGSLSQPSILWYLEPRQIGAPSAIDIVLGTTKLEDIDADALWARYRSARPDRPAASGFVCDSVLDIFGATPVTELVYDWLWNDLRQIGWVEGLFATRYW